MSAQPTAPAKTSEATPLVQEIFRLLLPFTRRQTCNVVAFLYLSMTLILSMGVKFMEQRMSIGV